MNSVIEYMSFSDADSAIKTLDGVEMRGSVVRVREGPPAPGQSWENPVSSFSVHKDLMSNSDLLVKRSAPPHLDETTAAMTATATADLLEETAADLEALDTGVEATETTEEVEAEMTMMTDDPAVATDLAAVALLGSLAEALATTGIEAIHLPRACSKRPALHSHVRVSSKEARFARRVCAW